MRFDVDPIKEYGLTDNQVKKFKQEQRKEKRDD
jgi:hypothetical protein